MVVAKEILKKTYIYILHQTAYKIFLFFTFIVPLVLFLKYSPYPFLFIEYFVLGALFVFQYILYNENDFRRSIEPKISKRLKKELGRTPSKKEIHSRANFIVVCRGGTIVWTGLEVLLVMFFLA